MSVTIEYTTISSPIGDVSVAASPAGVCTVLFDDEESELVQWLDRRFGQDTTLRRAADPAGAANALRAYFRGDIRALDALPVDAGGTAFQRGVWRRIRRIPAGKTATYYDLARAAGSPGATRAAGTACGSNPVGIVVPCHRVVPSAGGLGNYGGGVERKRWLLEHEGVL